MNQPNVQRNNYASVQNAIAMETTRRDLEIHRKGSKMFEFTLVYTVLLLATSLFPSEARDDLAAPAVPTDIEGDNLLRTACIVGAKHGTVCPRDGGWGTWGTWGACRGRCGSVGRRVRHRACDNPCPERLGATCAGPDIQSDTCTLQGRRGHPVPGRSLLLSNSTKGTTGFTSLPKDRTYDSNSRIPPLIQCCREVDKQGCRVDAFEKLVASDELRSQQLELVKVVHSRFPSLASKCFEARCRWELVEQVLKGGAASYWIALHCVKHNVGCPVRGGWSQWSEWSDCSADCGSGNRTRVRACSNPPPAVPSLNCEGPAFCSRTCHAVACAEKLDGHWSEWSPWSMCSVMCGDGIKRRERQCLSGCNDEVLASRPRRHPISGSAAIEMVHKLARSVDAENRCSGPKFELAHCQQGPCDVDGGWSDWEEWTACSTTCGLGMQVRSRSCSRPMQSGEGQPCAGAITDTRRCFRGPCSSVRHATAVFSGGCQLNYDAPATAHALLHLHLRFLPQKPSGHLAERVAVHNSNVTLRMAGGWLVLTANVAGCVGNVISKEPLELHEWHEVMAVVAGRQIALRVDDATEHLVTQLSCQPRQARMDAPMSIGRDFHGLVQFVAINFRPLALQRDCQLSEAERGFVPAATSNVQVERMARDVEEGFRHIRRGDLIAVPCPDSSGLWKVELSMRCDSDGLLVLFPGESPAHHVAVTLANGRIILACPNQAPVLADAEVAHGDWVLVAIDRTGTVEGGTCRCGPCDLGLTVNGGTRVSLPGAHECIGTMFLGAAPLAFQPEDTNVLPLEPLEGVAGSLVIDESCRDLVELPSAQLSGRQLSSHSICNAVSYVEVPAFPGQSVNLSGAYVTPSAEAADCAASAYWLRLDTVIKGTIPKEEGVAVWDDGQTTQLRIEPSNCREKVEGFYLAWVERSGGDRVLAAFGVVIETSDWSDVLGTGFLALGSASLLLSLLYMLFAIIGCCCPPPLDEECACPPPECPTAAPCPSTLPRPKKKVGPTASVRSTCSSGAGNVDCQFQLTVQARTGVGPPHDRHLTSVAVPKQSNASICQCTDSQPSLPSLPASHLDGSDIECELTTSDPVRRIRLPVTSVRFDEAGTVSLLVNGCCTSYSE